MQKKTPPVSVEAQIAVIYERVEVMHEALPVVLKTVNRHDREILIAKVLLAVALLIVSNRFPVIAEAVGKMLQ